MKDCGKIEYVNSSLFHTAEGNGYFSYKRKIVSNVTCIIFTSSTICLVATTLGLVFSVSYNTQFSHRLLFMKNI